MNNTTTNTTLVPDADGSYYHTSTNIEGPLAKGQVTFDAVRGNDLDEMKKSIKVLYNLFYDLKERSEHLAEQIEVQNTVEAGEVSKMYELLYEVQTHSESNRESFESLRVEAEQDIARLKADLYILQDEVATLKNTIKEDF